MIAKVKIRRPVESYLAYQRKGDAKTQKDEDLHDLDLRKSTPTSRPCNLKVNTTDLKVAQLFTDHFIAFLKVILNANC